MQCHHLSFILFCAITSLSYSVLTISLICVNVDSFSSVFVVCKFYLYDDTRSWKVVLLDIYSSLELYIYLYTWNQILHVFFMIVSILNTSIQYSKIAAAQIWPTSRDIHPAHIPHLDGLLLFARCQPRAKQIYQRWPKSGP